MAYKDCPHIDIDNEAGFVFASMGCDFYSIGISPTMSVHDLVCKVCKKEKTCNKKRCKFQIAGVNCEDCKNYSERRVPGLTLLQPLCMDKWMSDKDSHKNHDRKCKFYEPKSTHKTRRRNSKTMAK